jgi:hypothetical protein
MSITIAMALSLFAYQEPMAEPLLSGPLAGASLQPVKVYAERGEHRAAEFDATADLGAEAGALLFIHDLSRNTAPMIRAFAEMGEEFKTRGYAGWCVLLSDDRTAAEARLQAVNGSLKLTRPIVLSLDGIEGPGSYALNRRCTLTLVTAKKGVVVRSVAFTDTGAADAPKLRAWIEELLPPPPTLEERKLKIAASLPSDPEALQRLAIDQAIELENLKLELAKLKQQRPADGARAPMRGERMPRDTARPQRPNAEGTDEGRANTEGRTGTTETPRTEPAPGRAPVDAELTRLLRSLIRKDLEEARAKEIMVGIETRAAMSDALRDEAVQMFVRVLHYGDHYGNEASRALMNAFVAARK